MPGLERRVPLCAGLPVIFSVLALGLPSLLQLGGFVLALLAIGLISRPEGTKGRPEGIGMALLAGCGFGCFFILISHVSNAATLWPLAVARITSNALFVAHGGSRPPLVFTYMTVAPIVMRPTAPITTYISSF